MVIAKLEWAKQGDSERQLRDARGMVESRGRELDMSYIENWVMQLDLVAQWERVRPQAARRAWS